MSTMIGLKEVASSLLDKNMRISFVMFKFSVTMYF